MLDRQSGIVSDWHFVLRDQASTVSELAVLPLFPFIHTSSVHRQ